MTEYTTAPDSMRVEDIALSDTRAMNVCLNHFERLGDIRRTSDQELLRLENCGRHTLAIIRAEIGCARQPTGTKDRLLIEAAALRAERGEIDERRRQIGTRLREIADLVRSEARAERHAASAPARQAQQAKWDAARARKRAVVLAYLAGESAHDVAARFGVSRRTIEKDREFALRRYISNPMWSDREIDPEIKAAALKAGFNLDRTSDDHWSYYDRPLKTWSARRAAQNPHTASAQQGKR